MKAFATVIILLISGAAVLAQDQIAELQARLDANPNDMEALVRLGIACHSKALEGDKAAVKKGADYLSRAIEIDKGHALALSYLGSIYTLKGRDALLSWDKMKYVEQGVDLLDKAIDLEPENLQVRMVRAMNSLNLPDFFHRLQYSLKDFAFISTRPEFEKWPAKEQANVYHHFGMALLKDNKQDKAREQFDLAIQTAPESPWAGQAREQLSAITAAK